MGNNSITLIIIQKNEYKKSYAEYMMNAALERMNYIETEIAKVEGEFE